MEFDKDNIVVQLCALGMDLEGQGKLSEAGERFEEAWKVATTDFEKFTAAHYVARHQTSVSEKLKWDEVALKHALKINDRKSQEILPSLYLNIGKCYEDMADPDNARRNYEAAYAYVDFLPDDGYGNMIKAGIRNGIKRVE